MKRCKILQFTLTAMVFACLLPNYAFGSTDTVTESAIHFLPDETGGARQSTPVALTRTPDLSVFTGGRSVINVPADYSTIQAAIDAAASGDEIVVAAGTYPEQLVIAGKTLILTGAGAATCTIQAPVAMTSPGNNIYSIILLLGGANVELHDFTIAGPGNLVAGDYFVGLFVRQDSHLYSHDNDVLDIRTDPIDATIYCRAYWVGSNAFAEVGTADIVDNTLAGYQQNGVYCDGAGSYVTVTGCSLTGVGPADPLVQYGVRIQNGGSGDISGNTIGSHDNTGATYAAAGILCHLPGQVLVHDNTITTNEFNIWFHTNNTAGSVIERNDVSHSRAGITIYFELAGLTVRENTGTDVGNGMTLHVCSGTTLITDNTFTSIRYNGNGIYMFNTDDTVVTSNTVSGTQGGETWGLGVTAEIGGSSDNNTFTDNVVSGGLNFGAVVYSIASNTVFTGNRFANLDYGARVGNGIADYNSTGTVFHYNTFTALLGHGLWNDLTTGGVDAEFNFWDGFSGPDVAGNPGGTGCTLLGDVDYSPWLGFMHYIMPRIYHTNDSVEDAVAAASDGDVVHALPGTYTLPAQLVIDDDIMLYGDTGSPTTLVPGFDTTVGGYVASEAMIYVDYGVTTTIQDLVIDGSGHVVHHAVQSRGAALTVRNCEIRNIVAAPYFGRGIVYLTGSGLVEDCTMAGIQRIGVQVRGAVEPSPPTVTINGLTFTGKGPGDWLDYGVEFGGGSGGTVHGSTITACSGVALVDGSTSAGILATDYFGPGTTATIEDCVLTGNSTGVEVGYLSSDASVVSLHDCDLSGSTDYGVHSSGPLVDATANWWGHVSGPLDESDDTGTGGLYNPGGLGVPVSDGVLYVPWLGTCTLDFAVSASQAPPLNCSVDPTFMLTLYPDAYAAPIRGFQIRVTATPEVEFDQADITLNPDLTTGWTGSGVPQYYIVENGPNDYTVHYALLGTTNGIVGPTLLFSMLLDTVADGTAVVSTSDCLLRDLNNQPIDLACGESESIDIDCTAPAANVENFTAAPGHRKVELNWVDPSPVDWVQLEIWRARWHTGDNVTSAYPEYNDVNANEPVPPISRAAALASPEWSPVALLAFGAAGYVDNVIERGVYYYTVILVDAALNYGPPSPVVRATNYWLGDVHLPYDGQITIVTDIQTLALAYGTSEGHAAYNNECDVGPTSDWSGTGIPLTDSAVGFEDLMIFALNYGNVLPRPVQGSEIAMLAWSPQDDGTWTLSLAAPCAALKALHLTASLPAGTEVELTGGGLLTEQAGPVFLQRLPGETLDISLALLGRGLVLAGTGPLFSVRLTDGAAPGEIALDLRDATNAQLEFSLVEDESPDLPSAYHFAGNHPNPFNPKTEIRFDLPEAQFVRLVVFGIDGRRIATLLDERMAAGRHSAIWDGRDTHGDQVASGIYFCRIEAGPLKETRKMLLMK